MYLVIVEKPKKTELIPCDSLKDAKEIKRSWVFAGYFPLQIKIYRRVIPKGMGVN